MSDWMTRLLGSFADQAGTWFVGVVLALLGVFSGRLVETVKFALNRADLRAKYYEQLAIDVSLLVFAVDRLTKVYYGAAWATDELKSGIANAYDEAYSKIRSQEYVYLSWLNRYWNHRMADAFVSTMEKMRAVDAVLIQLNELSNPNDEVKQLEAAFLEFQKAAHFLLVTAN